MNNYPQTDDKNPFTNLLNKIHTRDGSRDDGDKKWLEKQLLNNEERSPEFKEVVVKFLKKRFINWDTMSTIEQDDLIKQQMIKFRIPKPKGGKRKTKKQRKHRKAGKSKKQRKTKTKTKTRKHRKAGKSKKQGKTKI